MGDFYLRLDGQAFAKNKKVMLLKAFYAVSNRLPGTPEINYFGEDSMIDPSLRLSVGLYKRQFLTLCCTFDYRMLIAESRENVVRYNAAKGFGFTFSGDEEWIKGCIDEINALSEEHEDYRRVPYLKTNLSPRFKGFSENMYYRFKKLSGDIFDIVRMRLSSNKTDLKMVDVQSAEVFHAYGPKYRDIVLETPDERHFLLYNLHTGFIFLPGVDEAKRAKIADILFER